MDTDSVAMIFTTGHLITVQIFLHDHQRISHFAFFPNSFICFPIYPRVFSHGGIRGISLCAQTQSGIPSEADTKRGTFCITTQHQKRALIRHKVYCVAAGPGHFSKCPTLSSKGRYNWTGPYVSGLNYRAHAAAQLPIIRFYTRESGCLLILLLKMQERLNKVPFQKPNARKNRYTATNCLKT